LVLKGALLRAPTFTGQPITASAQVNLKSHNLRRLWSDVKPVLADVRDEAGWGKPDSDLLDALGEYIRQFAELDPGSFSFRYALSKTGEPLLPDTLTHINLRHFAEMMERFAGYFENLDTAMYEFDSARADMLAEVAEMQAE
jgi:hypothetical protein